MKSTQKTNFNSKNLAPIWISDTHFSSSPQGTAKGSWSAVIFDEAASFNGQVLQKA